jgi:thiamine-phosphate pyrophosphorylase
MAMLRRQSPKFPKIWLMTDLRLGDALLAAIQRLPAGSGVVFRHYEVDEAERRRLFGQVRRVCRRRGHILLLAGPDGQARAWQADGFHGRAPGKARLHSAPAHNPREIAEAKRSGAQLLFLSPLFATRTHPDTRPLGLMRFNQLARLARPAKVIALGGMTRNRARSLDAQTVCGWAAINAFRK